MPNKNYVRGFNAEVRCMKELREKGYWTQRAYGSKGAYDVIAVSPVLTKLIEVKRVKHHIVSTEAVQNRYRESIEKMREIPLGAVKELWLWTDKQGVAGNSKFQAAHWDKFRLEPDGTLTRYG